MDNQQIEETLTQEQEDELIFNITLAFTKFTLKTISKEDLKELNTLDKTWKSQVAELHGLTQKELNVEIKKYKDEGKDDEAIAKQLIDDLKRDLEAELSEIEEEVVL